MNSVTSLFKRITSYGEINLVQEGFLHEARVDTREHKLILKDFLTLTRHFLKNNYLEIRFKIKGKENALSILLELEKFGLRVSVLRNELHWIILTDIYEVDALLTINLPEKDVKKLIEGFYVVVDAALVYPVGYMSWESYFNQNKIISHA